MKTKDTQVFNEDVQGFDLMTIAEAMSLAVLRGDIAVAYALADKLVEESTETQRSRAEKQALTRQHASVHDSFDVYRWPEFEAFCKRLGIMWDLRTTNLIIKMPCRARIIIQQEYVGSNVS